MMYRILVGHPHPGVRQKVVDTLQDRFLIIPVNLNEVYSQTESVAPRLVLLDAYADDSLLEHLLATGVQTALIAEEANLNLMRKAGLYDVALLTLPLTPGCIDAVLAGEKTCPIPLSAENPIDDALQPKGKDGTEIPGESLRSLTGTTLAKELIVVGSPKGGSGKTVIAVNLAATIHQLTGQSVALADLDVPWGDVPAQLQLTPERNLLAFRSSPEVIRESVVKEVMQRHSSGIYVLASPPGVFDESFIDPSLARKILTNLPRFFDYVVVDTGANLHVHTLEAFRYATKLICVTNYDTATLHDTTRWLNQLKARNIIHEPKDVWQIFNRVTGKEGIDLNEAQAFLGASIVNTVRWSMKIQRAINQGKIPSQADADFGEEIARIVHRLCPQARQSGGLIDRLRNLVAR
ncbi:AAA family ATPase [Heliobacterium undosum]|uniref:AAA family ATPase n=1 Tax=Heliomicrobium undosum TaxID=121734 RepID=A0A845L4F3_9FIRM|nr:AAA family ATPase [Heliomicrobium undosum]MZP31173.1 AAA family ATPase [Heliomicrobium undosum]